MARERVGYWITAVLALACGCNGEVEPPESAAVAVSSQALLAEDEIDKKWESLGGATVMGQPTTGHQPLGIYGKFRRYANGTIFYSEPYGAVNLQHAVFDRWVGLGFGPDPSSPDWRISLLGLPRRDWFHITLGVSEADHTEFERGLISSHSGTVFVIWGRIYDSWSKFHDQLGLPHSDEGVAPNGDGRQQGFEWGQILIEPEGQGGDGRAHAIWGPMVAAWYSYGSVYAELGFPRGEPAPVRDANGDVIGRMGVFAGGDLYISPATGTHMVKGEIAKAYRERFGGPTGWLGFPIGELGFAMNGDHYTDFQGGMLIDHKGPDEWTGVVPFRSVPVALTSFSSGAKEGACGSVDIFTNMTIDLWDLRAQSYTTWLNNARFPDVGTFTGGGEINYAHYPVVPIANSNLAINVTVSVTEVDDPPFCLFDEGFGSTAQMFSVHNLWGLASSHKHTTCGAECAEVYFGTEHPLPYDPNDFRGQMWWSFENYKIPELSYDTYAATFSDVSPNESTGWHPFNSLYYSLVYKGRAAGGVCFGMALESAFAGRGESIYSQPIHQYFPTTQDGRELTAIAATPARDDLIEQISRRHGFEVGRNDLLYSLGRYLAGDAHDPVANYDELAEINRTDTLLFITSDYFLEAAHTVQPYKWEQVPDAACDRGEGDCYRIHVADPNYPSADSNGDQDHIDINIDDNEFFYRDYQGHRWGGGRLLIKPFSLYDEPQETLFSDFFGLLDGGIFALVGGSGSVTQVSDQEGRTLFEPGLSAPPTRWDQIRHDDAARIPYLVPIMVSGQASGGGFMPYQAFGGQAVGVNRYFDIARRADQVADEPYDMVFHSARLSSVVQLVATQGLPDRFTAGDVNVDAASAKLAINPFSAAKTVRWTLAGTNKHRWSELSELIVQPGQEISIRPANAGFALEVDNNGPATSARLSATGNGAAALVNVGTIQIPSGTSTIDVQQPRTALTLSNVVPGNAGWLLAPPTVTLTASDLSGKGIQRLEHGPNGITWTPYGGPFAYARQGDYPLYYRAVDGAANASEMKTERMKLDTEAPAGTVAIAPNAASYSFDDARSGSGLATVHASLTKLDGSVESSVLGASGSYPLTSDYSQLEVWAEDVAGNVQAPLRLRNADYRGVVLQDSPVGYWRLDDAATSAVAKDIGSGGIDGTYTAKWPDSPLPWPNQKGGIASDPNVARYFTISNNPNTKLHPIPTQDNWVTIPHDGNQTSPSFSIEAWFTLGRGQQTYAAILSKTSYDYGDGYGFYYYGNQLYFYVGWRTTRIGLPMWDTATYQHVVGTYDSESKVMTFYLNGVEVGHQLVPHAVNFGTAPLRIGKGYLLSWVGFIDEVALYNDVLPLPRVRAHYEAGTRQP